MFGYIKLDSYASSRQKDYFKRNYCFLCRALDKHYGFFARLFVSYDVTFFGVLFSPDNYLASIKKVPCFKTAPELRERVQDEFAKKVAALNLALAAGELIDNIEDKDKFYAKLLYGAYKGVFKKVKKDYPLLWQIVEEGHRSMSRVEAENGATAGKFDLAKRAKELGLDAIHDTVHEMARDEARHGKAFEGLLVRYFK